MPKVEIKPKLGKGKATIPTQAASPQKVIQQAFEDYLPLQGFASIQQKGRNVGAYILQRNGAYKFVFGFRSTGIHDTLREDQIQPTAEAVEAALKELLPEETLTFHLSSFCSDTDRQQDLDECLASAPSDQLKLLAMSEKARAQQLKASGIRKPKELFIYCSFSITLNQKTDRDSDWIEKFLASGFQWWDKFKGLGPQMLSTQYQNMLQQAFTDGYLRWEQLLGIKMGLTIHPLSVDQLWAKLWDRFNSSAPSPLQQHLVLDEGGQLNEVIDGDVHPTSLLVEGESGLPSVPKASRRWVKVRGKYVGALSFVSKPVGFADARSQLRYLWDVLCKPYVFDTEVFCQVTPGNSTLVRTKMQRVLKQSNVMAAQAEKQLSIDVAASIKTKRSVEAQERLYEGAIPVKVGTVFLVHRDSVSKLDEACFALSESFQLPAKVVRETEVTWMTWLQTLPISWDKLQGKPHNRQMTYLTNEAAGLMPLTLTRTGDRRGFELIADEGGSPVRINFIDEHKNLAVFGTTRSGKSVLVSGMMSMFLEKGYPIVCMDYPKPDGTSTFTDYALFLKPRAAYFDVGKESNNLLEVPDLRHLDETARLERFDDYKSFLESAIVTMVVPQTKDQMLEQTVRSIIGRALTNFFNHPDIQARYDAAHDGGFGSPAWNETPTLHDFLDFCTLESLDIEDSGAAIKGALSQVRLQLNYWLDSRIGRAIARPSSFQTDAQLLVFALRNLSNENEAAILSLSAYSAALRRALASPKSIFFIDESPILFEFATISQLIGRLCANGAKAGIRVMLSAQDPDTIMKSSAGPKVMQNMTARLIGRIQPLAIESFVRLLNYERSVIARNAGESFFPKASELYSNWLLDSNGTYTYCRYYPGPVQIAVVANNPDEQSARTRLTAKYSDPLEGIARFADLYCQSIRTGSSLDHIG